MNTLNMKNLKTTCDLVSGDFIKQNILDLYKIKCSHILEKIGYMLNIES